MDAEEFTKLLKNPALLRNYSLEELLWLSKEFPFSQTIYPLIVKKAQLLNDGEFENYLHRAAINVADRNKLFHFIHSTVLNGEGKHEEEPVIVPVKKTKRETPELELSKTEVISREEVTEEKIIPEKIIEIPPVKKKRKIVVEKKEKKENPAEKISKKIKKAKPVKKEKLKGDPQKESPEIKKAVIKPESEISWKDKHTFAEWLKLVKGEGEIVSKFSEGEKENKEEINKKREEKKLLLSEDVFETGIRATRKIKTTPEEEEAMSRKAKESIKQTHENITETLAKVFEIQKKYDKAIHTYEALILKYPDKNAYFARKIKTLKGKL